MFSLYAIRPAHAMNCQRSYSIDGMDKLALTKLCDLLRESIYPDHGARSCYLHIQFPDLGSQFRKPFDNTC